MQRQRLIRAAFKMHTQPNRKMHEKSMPKERHRVRGHTENQFTEYQIFKYIRMGNYDLTLLPERFAELNNYFTSSGSIPIFLGSFFFRLPFTPLLFFPFAQMMCMSFGFVIFFFSFVWFATVFSPNAHFERSRAEIWAQCMCETFLFCGIELNCIECTSPKNVKLLNCGCGNYYCRSMDLIPYV